MSAADDSRPTTGPATTGRAGSGSSKVVGRGPSLRIHWGRLSIALVGAVALSAALITSVLAVIGLVSSVLPVVALLTAIASVVVLRTLAVRGRRRSAGRVPAASQEPAAEPTPERHTAQRPTTLFNAEDPGNRNAAEKNTNNDDADTAVDAPVQFTAAELRAAALAVAAESGENPAGAGTPWQPVQVPKPTYIEAPKAEREDPAPLDLPEAPKPQAKTPIKNGAVAPKTAAAPQAEAPATPKMNLDDILQRRRA
ncbi:hypothetical protein GCM10027404_02740 [Arthrobacter tumbae]